MNGWQSNWLATEFAARLQREADGEPTLVVEIAFQSALGRLPSQRERELSLQFLQEQSAAEFALAMFNLNEFLYVR
jgi:hypothetical protein